MKYIKRFEVIDHSQEDPFSEETWRDPIPRPPDLKEPTEMDYEYTKEDFDQYLDSMYPSCKIGPEEFKASNVLKTMNPYVYEIMFNEFNGEEKQELWNCPICGEDFGSYKAAKFHCQRPIKRPKEDKYNQYKEW